MTRRVLACALVLCASPVAAQVPPSARAFDLAALQQAAIDTDPRAAQVAILESQSALRQRNIAANWLPVVNVDGQTQYQSDVAHVPFTTPTGRPIFSPPKGTFDTGVRVDQRLFDPTVSVQRQLERAQLAEQQARVRAVLFPLRQQVNEAFFSALALQARAAALDAAITDLEGRLRETAARVVEGAALAADAAAIEAALLERRQDALELQAGRRVALAHLADLTGVSIGEGDTLAVPRVDATVTRARQESADVRARPEFAMYARTRERLMGQQALAAAQERPRVTTFGRVGVGRPGLNFASDAVEGYGLGGVRVQWNAWNWGVPARERAALNEQARIVAADEAALARTLRQAVRPDEAALDRLRDTVALDDRIIALREQVSQSTDVRFREGVVTVSDYLARVADLQRARMAKTDHEVQLAQAGARLLTTLGLEVR